MTWQIVVDVSVRKKLLHIPHKDVERIEEALDQLEDSPFGGDAHKMGGQENTWRRRVGSYRLFYDIFVFEKTVLVFNLKRRGSKTY
ncbi:MAG: type II toxin-antitoxin system RelE/ParE family toxin [Patescibacteria group bacterium]